MPTRFTRHISRTLRLSATGAALILTAIPAWGAPAAAYLFNLSDFTGTIPYSWVRVSPDPTRREVYVYNTGDSSIRVFNDMGMQIYSFNEGGELGAVRDITVTGNGDVLALVSSPGGYGVKVCNYRGELTATLTVAGMPAEAAAGFSPELILFRNGTIYLVDRNAMKAAAVDPAGNFLKAWSFGPLLGVEEKKLRDAGIIGFDVDPAGNMVFSVPVFFTAYVVTPEGKMTAFGTRGSSPGKFNVIGGIACDGRGHIYVVDTLRCVVMVFDDRHSFITEFGYRGEDPGNLIAPMNIAVQNDLLFVTQSRSRGVSVFRMQFEERQERKGGDAPTDRQ